MQILVISRTNVHHIHLVEPHVNSFAAYLLLKDALKKAEMAVDLNVELPQKGRHNWKLHVAFNTRFLERVLKENGILSCV